MSWYLAQLTNQGTATRRALTDSEIEAYEGAEHTLLSFWSDQWLFALLALNYDTYQGHIERATNRLTRPGPLDRSFAGIAEMHLNRHILNYLTSVRTYLDHTEANLKWCRGKGSKEVGDFREVCSREYDTHFSYRFLYRLRNYVQHVGLPVGAVSSYEGVPDSTSLEAKRFVSFDFKRDSLLEGGLNWGPTVGQELRNHLPEFPIHPHMAQMLVCPKDIHWAVIGDRLPEIAEAALFVKQLASTVDVDEIDLGLVRLEEADCQGQTVAEIRRIPWAAAAMALRARASQKP